MRAAACSDDPELVLLQERGDRARASRTSTTSRPRAGRRSTIALDGSIADDGERLRAAEAETLAAMRAASTSIYQATFFDGRWRGHADFLLRVEIRTGRRVGDWHYEVADTKLARPVKAGAVLQICVYVERLDGAPGRPPELDPRRARRRAPTRSSGCASTTSWPTTARVKGRFLDHVAADDPPRFPPIDTYPDPVDHCDVCRWAPSARPPPRRRPPLPRRRDLAPASGAS